MRQTLKTRVTDLYPVINKWAIRAFGPQDYADYVHDGVVSLLSSKAYSAYTTDAVLGTWRIMTQQAQAERRAQLRGHYDVEVSTDNLDHTDEQARRILKEVVPRLPQHGRCVVAKLYIGGLSIAKVAREMGLSEHRIKCINKLALQYIAELVRREGD
jgi:DNA-directed RNA polymerase specialized sigma24 family protein